MGGVVVDRVLRSLKSNRLAGGLKVTTDETNKDVMLFLTY